MEQLKNLVMEGDVSKTEDRVRGLLAQGSAAEEIMNKALIPAMDKVGILFQNGEYYLPEMLVAARAMQQGLRVLKPILTRANVTPAGKAVIGTVKGDLHDIGKNLVGISLEGAGFEVIDLGADVPVETFVEAVREHRPAVLGLSALLTTTMPVMREVIEAVKTSGLRSSVKIMIGGAPITQRYADEIGADFYGHDSTSAKDYARKAA